jgi:hypothetical protein
MTNASYQRPRRAASVEEIGDAAAEPGQNVLAVELAVPFDTVNARQTAVDDRPAILGIDVT